jgi:aspartyl-tRNA(Asn)/glutamyl-tRNA(Gln) amidotransferase subunit A
MSNEWAFVSVRSLGEALREGDVTSRELTEYVLDRLACNGPALNCLAVLTRDRALRDADEADADFARGVIRSPLQGIPYGAKDLLATTDVPTTWGATTFRDQQFDHDAAIIQRLTDAGAILVGKLAMVELAGGWGYEQPNASLHGPGRNAWDRDRWAGGSSSGSGSAVGAGLVPFAIGTETWGSIHCPSVFNGITGLRPTYGRVSRAGAMALSWTMDKIGPMARDATDCMTVLRAIAGPDRADAPTLGAPELRFGQPATGLRIGVLEGAIEQSASSVGANARQAVQVLESFGAVTPMSLPDLPMDEAASIIIMCEAASAFQEFIEAGKSAELTAPEDHDGMWHALEVPAVDYLRAMRIRAEAIKQMDEIFGRFDVLVAPTYSVVAPMAEGSFNEHFDKHEAVSLSGMGNLTGLPSITVPNGLGEDNLPTGIEILGRWWDESRIVQLAEAYQGATQFHLAQPPAWAVGQG